MKLKGNQERHLWEDGEKLLSRAQHRALVPEYVEMIESSRVADRRLNGTEQVHTFVRAT